jgi:hypothetical protein
MKVDSAISLGPPEKLLHPERIIAVFAPKRGKALRWLSGIAALILIGSGICLLAYGGYIGYTQYFKHGPAVINRSLLPFIIPAILALWIGVWLLLAALKRTAPQIALLEGGIEFNQGGKTVTWHWEDMASIRSTLSHKLGLTWRTEHIYTLVRLDGERLILNDTLKDVEKLAEHIRAWLLPVAGSRALPAFYNGTELDFGEIRISLKGGMSYRKHKIAWDSMRKASINNGMLTIELDTVPKTPKKIILATDEIPNVDILLAVVQKMIASKPLPPLIPGKTSSAANG